MGLFWKIFLGFLVAVMLVIATSLAVSRITQTEPFADRFKKTAVSNLEIYIEAIKQTQEFNDIESTRKFVEKVEHSYQNKGVCLITVNEQSCLAKFDKDAQTITNQAFSSDEVQFKITEFNQGYSAKRFTGANRELFVLLVKSELSRPLPPFGDDITTRVFRILAMATTGFLVCYVFAFYLAKPILRLRDTTKQFADGNLQARSNIKQSDEIGQLSRDFDEMAGQIESLITSQANLTRDISHELRSPLARINVAIELAKNCLGDNEFLNCIEAESQELNEMISNILVLSKLESKTAFVEKANVNLTELVAEVFRNAEFEAIGKNKSVELLQNDEITLSGNKRLLRSAIENILRNAIRYTKNKVEVSLKKGSDTAIIKIRDYGDGIPEKELTEIFRPFYRANQSTEQKSDGVGIGLAITAQAVYAHKGTVSARNLADGLVMEISLPIISI